MKASCLIFQGLEGVPSSLSVIVNKTTHFVESANLRSFANIREFSYVCVFMLSIKCLFRAFLWFYQCDSLAEFF